jgi:hypothetical protein
VAQYIANIQATAANSGTENAFLALTVPSGNRIQIVRLRVSIQDVGATDACRIRALRTSTLGSTPTSATPIKKDPLTPVSIVTLNEKNGATGWTPGTLIEVIDDVSFNARSMLQWEMIDEDDYLIIDSSGIFELTVNNSTANSVLTCATVEWIEH